MARIGIDLDDTITDIKNEMLKMAIIYDKTLRGTGIIDNSSYLVGKKFDWTDEERDIFLKEYRLKIIENAMIREDAIETLKKLKEKSHEIIIITARNNKYYHDPYKFTYDWLIKNNVPFDKLITNATNKGLICKEMGIDYFLDDSIENCLDVKSFGIKSYLMYNGYDFKNKEIEVIYSFSDLLNIID